MTILLTGHEGFIGRNLYKHLPEAHVIHERDVRQWRPRQHYEVCIHLAAEAGVRRSHSVPNFFWQRNVEASQHLFYEMPETYHIYASSSSVYEWWLSPYAMTKKAVEHIAPEYSLGLRFHTVYGPDSRPDMFFDKLCRDEIDYVTEHERDWTHVDDLCEAVITLMGHRLRGTIDVGTGSPSSVIDVAKHYRPERDYPVKQVVGERERTCARPKELKALGWRPRHHILLEEPSAYLYD